MSLFSDINTRDVGRTREKDENHEPIETLTWLSLVGSRSSATSIYARYMKRMTCCVYNFFWDVFVTS